MVHRALGCTPPVFGAGGLCSVVHRALGCIPPVFGAAGLCSLVVHAPLSASLLSFRVCCTGTRHARMHTHIQTYTQVHTQMHVRTRTAHTHGHTHACTHAGIIEFSSKIIQGIGLMCLGKKGIQVCVEPALN